MLQNNSSRLIEIRVHVPVHEKKIVSHDDMRPLVHTKLIVNGNKNKL